MRKHWLKIVAGIVALFVLVIVLVPVPPQRRRIPTDD